MIGHMQTRKENIMFDHLKFTGKTLEEMRGVHRVFATYKGPNRERNKLTPFVLVLGVLPFSDYALLIGAGLPLTAEALTPEVSKAIEELKKAGMVLANTSRGLSQHIPDDGDLSFLQHFVGGASVLIRMADENPRGRGTCSQCGKRFSVKDIDPATGVCANCFIKTHRPCSVCGNWVGRQDMVPAIYGTADKRLVCKRCAEGFPICARCGQLLSPEYAVHVRGSSQVLCRTCLGSYRVCAVCGEASRLSEMQTSGNWFYHPDCLATTGDVENYGRTKALVFLAATH